MKTIKEIALGSAPLLGLIFLGISHAALLNGDIGGAILFGALAVIALFITSTASIYVWDFWNPERGVFKTWTDRKLYQSYLVPLRLTLVLTVVSLFLVAGVLVLLCTLDAVLLQWAIYLILVAYALFGVVFLSMIIGFGKSCADNYDEYYATD
jgi:hypothetical protein